MKKRNNAVGPLVRAKPARRSRLLPALAVGSLIGGLQSATQYFAYTFAYQAQLGANFHHAYAPWSILRWMKWSGVYPTEFRQAESIGVLVAAGGMLTVAVARSLSDSSAKANEFMQGSARWADREDIEAAGLLPRERTIGEAVLGKEAPKSAGVYVGGWVGSDGKFYYLRHNGPEHVLTYAPTRSGKGVGLVVPTLLSWAASCVITDLKGELWAMTAGWRKQHAKNKVIRFEPASGKDCAEWNPLDEIRLGTDQETGDVQNIANLIVDPEGKGLDSHWTKTAFALLQGVIMHAKYKEKLEGIPATLPGVDAMLADPNRSVQELWMEMATYGHINGENHPIVGRAARDMMDRPEEEAGSVLSTAKSFLALYRDPVVARNVSKSSWRIRDLMNHDSPVSLYIITQPVDAERMKPLVRLLMNSIVRVLADGMEFERVQKGAPLWRKLLARIGFKSAMQDYIHATLKTKINYKHKLLMMVDEFPSLGKLPIIQKSLAFCAGYGIKFYLICQDINQLKSKEEGYGPDETISSNCHVQNAYPPNRPETAEHISKLTGVTTVVKEQITTSGKRMGAVLAQVSKTYQEVQRPLLTVDECLRLPGPKKEGDLIVEAGDMVLYIAGYPMVYGKQPLFFKDPAFNARAAVPEPRHTDRIHATVSQREEVVI